MTIQLMHFSTIKVPMCMYLKNISKVLPLVALEPVPGGPAYLAGLMNKAGKTIPVIDLAIRSGLVRTEPYSLNTPILICSNDRDESAFIVDNVFGLITIDEKNLQMEQKFNKENSPFLASIVHELNSLLLINVDFMLKVNMAGDYDTHENKN